jgi:hypothetical protein
MRIDKIRERQPYPKSLNPLLCWVYWQWARWVQVQPLKDNRTPVQTIQKRVSTPELLLTIQKRVSTPELLLTIHSLLLAEAAKIKLIYSGLPR